MYISRDVAQAIIEEIGEEIQEQMILADAKGYIIASTDRSRIDTIHEGARQIITNGLSEFYVSAEMETETTKMGISLPLTIHDEIIGVVGITGERERVARYGNIVRRMTEIMISDRIQKDVRRYDRRVRYRFMEEWISKSALPYSQSFIERGYNLGIDITRPRRALIIYLPDYPVLSDTLEGQKLLEEMENYVRHEMRDRGVLYLREPPKQICLVPNGSDEDVCKTALALIHMIEDRYGKRVVIGIDSGTGNKLHMRECCMQADRAASYALLWDEAVVCYDELNIELFLDEVQESTMQEYLDKLFHNIPKEKLNGYMNLIEVYFAYNGSITQMADALYMHKNTLQYKLKKLADLTGKDIRLPIGTSVFYMAMLFYQKLYRGRTDFRKGNK